MDPKRASSVLPPGGARRKVVPLSHAIPEPPQSVLAPRLLLLELGEPHLLARREPALERSCRTRSRQPSRRSRDDQSAFRVLRAGVEHEAGFVEHFHPKRANIAEFVYWSERRKGVGPRRTRRSSNVAEAAVRHPDRDDEDRRCPGRSRTPRSRPRGPRSATASQVTDEVHEVHQAGWWCPTSCTGTGQADGELLPDVRSASELSRRACAVRSARP